MSTSEKTLAVLVEVTETPRVLAEPSLRLFDEGLLDSLGAVTLIARLSEEFGVEISPAEFDRDAWATPALVVADMQRRVNL